MNSYVGQASINGAEPVACQIFIEQEREVIRSELPRPDPQWEYTDAAGHYHARDKGGDYPTLIATTENRPCDGSCGGVCGGEGYTVTQYRCRICKENIKPGVLTGVHETVLPGPKSWRARVAAWLKLDDEVSVRFVYKISDSREAVLFGTAMTVDGSVTNEYGTIQSSAELVGTGKLGMR